MREHNSMEKYADWQAPIEKSELSPSENLSRREATLFEKMRHSGKDIIKVLTFISAFSAMSERSAFAKGDQPLPPTEKPDSSEVAPEMKRLDIETRRGDTDTKAQEKNIAYFADGKTLEIFGRLDMTIVGNSIVPKRDLHNTMVFAESDNGVPTDSVSLTSEISGNDSTIVITAKNGDGSVDVIKYVNGLYESAQSSAADSLKSK